MHVAIHYLCSSHFLWYRISKENRILAALWYGTIKPDMSLFMKPIAHTLKQLYDDGKLADWLNIAHGNN